MIPSQTVADDLVRAIEKFGDVPALSDQNRTISYGRLGAFPKILARI